MMNATQLISLHLAVHRPKPESDDPHFGPYINMLPSDYDSHPLTWLVRDGQDKASHHERGLLSMLPPSIFEQLCGVCDRFRKDWDAVSQCIVSLLIVGGKIDMLMCNYRGFLTPSFLGAPSIWISRTSSGVGLSVRLFCERYPLRY